MGQPRPPSDRQGFALLITITLLAFLVLLLVSLASLTRVETVVATNARQLAEARQNALFALNIALGQLQKYAGPDQRVTTRADLENTPGQPTAHWTGIYGSSVAADYEARPETIATDLSSSANLSTRGSPARLLNWLVSGNEDTDFDPVRGGTNVGPLGNIVQAPASAPFLPGATVLGLAADTPATALGITIANASNDNRPARLLVGGHSVVSSIDNNVPVDYVVAPAKDIEVSAGQVPGHSGSAPVTVGRYAWWVGDEGVKARINLPQAGTDPALISAERQERIRDAYVNSPRAAIELMTSDAAALPLPALNATRIGTAYDPAWTVSKILAPAQTPLSSGMPDDLAGPIKYRHHDITAVSASVLSDAYAGGLKRDLGLLLAASPAAADPTADARRLWMPHASDNGSGGTYAAGYGIPTWRHLRDYYQTRVPASDALQIHPPANDKAGTTDDIGLAPVLTYYAIGARFAPSGGVIAAGTAIHMNLHPLVVLWNPYDFTLLPPDPESDGSHFEVGIFISNWAMVRLQKRDPSSPANPFTEVTHFNFQTDTATGGSGDNRDGYVAGTPYHVSSSGGAEYIRFRLRLPSGGIPPGQSLVFSLPPGAQGDYNQRNILESREPESTGHVSVPIWNYPAGTPLTVASGETDFEWRMLRHDGTFSGGTGNNHWHSGRIDLYLGQPASALRVQSPSDGDAAGRAQANPSANDWYASHTGIEFAGGNSKFPSIANAIQGPATLGSFDPTADEPAFGYNIQAFFSGYGHNDDTQLRFSSRWLAQGNPRATRTGRTRRDQRYNVLYSASTAAFSVDDTIWQRFDSGSGPAGNRASAGRGHDWINGAPVDASLFEFPRVGQVIQSIGQLQHANLSLVGAYPAYPIGNSLGDFRLHGNTGTDFTSVPAGWQLVRTDSPPVASGQPIRLLAGDMAGYYDASYLLNRALWDRYYFSTVPAAGNIPDTLPNPRYLRYGSGIDLRSADESAAGLLLAGGFNINSTSEQAWRAVLGGGRGLPYDPATGAVTGSTSSAAAFPRFATPGAANGDASLSNAWQGYRTLDDDQISRLAREIVGQVRARGPFVSLADFVNRRLTDNTATTDENETFRGPLQAAIDRSVTGSFPANNPADGFWNVPAERIPAPTGGQKNSNGMFSAGYYDEGLMDGRLGGTSVTREAARSTRSAFAPKHITQADILSKIGAGLAARSDTFTIRAYGEVVNPATGETTAQSWCEAVVQRLPAYVGNTPAAWESPSASDISQTFGRKFQIVSFRWLSSNEI